MIGRKLILVAAALALCLGGTSTVVHARACPAKCKTEIKDCRQTECAALPTKHKMRAKCVRACKSRFVTACKAAHNPAACSPSGAFVD